jgi:hypothetical protein
MIAIVFFASRARLYSFCSFIHPEGLQTQCSIPKEDTKCQRLCHKRRFLASNKIVLRAVTHICQRSPEQLQREALDFIEYAGQKIVGQHRHQAIVINMDQTTIFFGI